MKMALLLNKLITNIAVWDGVSEWDVPGHDECEITGLKRFGEAVHNRYGNAYTHNIVIDGNSLAAAASSAPELAVIDAGLALYDFINMSFSGATVTDLTTLAATRIDPLYESAMGANNILLLWEGINEILAGKTDIQTYDNIKAYCTARKLKGWKIIVGTLTPRNGGAVNQETKRLSVNTMIRDALAAQETWLDAIADVGGDSLIGVTVSGTYYYDGLHLNATGHGIAKTYFTSAVEGLT